MAYNDRRRDTWAAIFARQPHPNVWLWLNSETGKPEVTRRTVGLRKYHPVSQRQDLISVEFIQRNHFTPRGNWTGRKPTGLHVVRVRAETGEEFDLPAMGNGTTVWIEDPNPGKNEVVREPLPEAVSVPEEPEPEYDLTPVEVGALKARIVELEAEVARLKEKYETPCPGLVHGTHFAANGAPVNDIRHCGGYLGHSGECAEVW